MRLFCLKMAWTPNIGSVDIQVFCADYTLRFHEAFVHIYRENKIALNGPQRYKGVSEALRSFCNLHDYTSPTNLTWKPVAWN